MSVPDRRGDRGPAAVFALHGLTGTGASWAPVADLLGVGWAVDAPDLPGHGEHHAGFGGAALPADFGATVDILASWVRGRHGDRRPVLAGYSLGARLAVGLLVEHPELFAGAVLLGARPGLGDAAARQRRAADDDARAASLEGGGLGPFVDAWERQPLFRSQRALPEGLRRAQRRMRLDQRPAGLAWALRTLSLGRMPDYRGGLGRVRVPVRLLVGALDVDFHEPARSMAAALPRGEARIIDGAGHNLILESPRAVAAVLQEAYP